MFDNLLEAEHTCMHACSLVCHFLPQIPPFTTTQEMTCHHTSWHDTSITSHRGMTLPLHCSVLSIQCTVIRTQEVMKTCDRTLKGHHSPMP